ncbi:gas vesicle protein [Streptomyces sp. NPDC019937]|uniref:gas vesicle protein n=1 Tax=unclassified Streptomyces TaxID=2593676 RepID=UPI0033D9C31B
MTHAIERREVALVDLLDRVLAGGVVIAGEITLSIADIDLVRISLRALIASVRIEDMEDADEHRAPP